MNNNICNIFERISLRGEIAAKGVVVGGLPKKKRVIIMIIALRVLIGNYDDEHGILLGIGDETSVAIHPFSCVLCYTSTRVLPTHVGTPLQYSPGVGWCLSRDYRVLRGEITRIKRPVRWCQGHLKFMFPYRILIPKRKCITTYDSTFLLSNPILSLPKQWGWWTICEFKRSLVFHFLFISVPSLLINYLDKSPRMTTNCK